MKFYKFKSLIRKDQPPNEIISKYVSDIIIEGELYCSDYKELNDPFEGLFLQIIKGFSPAFASNTFTQTEDKLHEISDPFKICSLSKRLNDVRMWSFYANDHKGVAIEIDFTGFKNDIKKVVYENELQKVHSAVPDPYEILTKKTEHWIYESEHRIIQKNKFYLVKGRINKIYIGQRISPDHLEELKKITPPAIAIHRTKLDTNKIKIVDAGLVER